MGGRKLAGPVRRQPDMTQPRQVLPGSTKMVTRRCSERRFFLRPSAVVNQAFRYCLGYAAEQTGVLLHAWTAMSNHWHAVVTDVEGRLPEFMAHVNKLVGKCVNADLGRWESLWANEHYSAVNLETEEDVLDKLLYVLANPLDAALVKCWSQWPGALSGPRACAAPLEAIRRPEVFFNPVGQMPESVGLEATVPPCFEHLGPRRFASKLAAALKAREAGLREGHRARGRRILGRKGVLAQDPFACPKDFEPRRGLNPRIACRDKWRRIEALGQLKEFLDAYREAWLAFRRGVKRVVFPAGTYWMCRHAGLPSVPPG